jgi:hypothetical protein
MRRMAFVCVSLLVALSGCASRLVDFAPTEEAVYEQPIDEVWPQVRQYFASRNFALREAPGAASLETEWREEFAGSRVAAYWHRYLVVAKQEGPHRCKLIITRESRSANKTLAAAGSELIWSVDGRTADNPSGIGSQASIDQAQRAFTTDAAIMGQSQQTARDTVMEWKVFRELAPVLAQNARKSSDVPEVVVKKNADIECGVPILGLGKVARAGNVVLLGELHGTQQVPHFIAQSACQAAIQGIPVTVGLEIPDVNQERLQSFVASEGKELDWSKLMESPFWRSPYPDGRNSDAVAYLIESLRKLRQQGLDIQVFAYDRPPLEGDAREEAMANTVLEFAARSPKRALLVVSGNLHPRQVKGLPWNPDYRPMGLRIASVRDKVYSLDIAYNTGTAWVCAVNAEQKLDCGVKPTKGQDNGERYFVHLFDGRKQGYHGTVSASLPAVYQGVEPAGSAPEPAAEPRG